MALHNCDEVAVAGFGYDMSTPRAPLHYYEKLMMSAIKESWTHNISKEKEFLQKLVKGGVIQDLTGGIWHHRPGGSRDTIRGTDITAFAHGIHVFTSNTIVLVLKTQKKQARPCSEQRRSFGRNSADLLLYPVFLLHSRDTNCVFMPSVFIRQYFNQSIRCFIL